VALLDWAMYGAGHVCWELFYFLREAWGRAPGSPEQDEALLRAYHRALVEVRAPPRRARGGTAGGRR
jgi:hypothetical protein